MMISTKGRYALRVMIDLAEHQSEGYVPLKEIAARQEISEKYLESIQVHFLNLPSYRRFPNDDEFKRELKVRDLYNFRSRSYWL